MTGDVFDSKPLPPVNADTRPFWDACSEGKLLLQRCDDCGAHQFYPRLMCSACGSRAVHWVQANGQGEVRTFTIIRRAVSAAFEADVPYVVALVQLAEGPTMMSNIVGCPVEAVHIGMAVEVAFEPRGTMAVPVFELAGGPASRLAGGLAEG